MLSFALASQSLTYLGRPLRIETTNTMASICLEGSPERQCYRTPEGYRASPKAEVVSVDRNTAAILFSAETVGVSGFMTHFALLQPGKSGKLDNLFMSPIELSNLSEHDFFSEPSLSGSKIFLTADYVSGNDESHYQPHRYIVSAYLRTHSELLEGSYYFLADQYMTVRKYELRSKGVLKAERSEILRRLRQVVRHHSKPQSRPAKGAQKVR